MREIPLTRGMVSIVDDSDYDMLIASGSWCAHPGGNTFYAWRGWSRGGKPSGTLMHTFLTGWSFTDHRNGDGLDNRRVNLRPATHAQNMMNRGMPRNNTSGYKGVYSERGMWLAKLQFNKRGIRLGLFADRLDAARAYDAAAHRYFGEFARPNFPQDQRDGIPA